jgi:hypothetical protein
MTVQTARHDLARRTRCGIAYILAGVLLWTVFGALGLTLPDSPRNGLIYLFGAGLLWPLGLAIGAALRLDLFARDNPLTSLAGLLGSVQILFIPLMIGAYVTTPQAVPWYLAVLVGAHFLPFAWLYDSRAYVFCAVATVAAAGLSAWMLPAATYIVTPFAVAAVLAVTVVLLVRQSAACTGERAEQAEEPGSHRAA